MVILTKISHDRSMYAATVANLLQAVLTTNIHIDGYIEVKGQTEIKVT